MSPPLTLILGVFLEGLNEKKPPTASEGSRGLKGGFKWGFKWGLGLRVGFCPRSQYGISGRAERPMRFLNQI